MIPLWIGSTNKPAPDGYWPPPKACVNFTLRGSDAVLSGYSTSVDWKSPDGWGYSIAPVFVVKNGSFEKVYMVGEVQCWDFCPEEKERREAGFGQTALPNGEILPRKDPGEVKFVPT